MTIAIGVVKLGNKFLVGQRPEGDDYAGQWEFPGGKSQNGEPPTLTVARELMEEVGILVTPGPVILHTQFRHADSNHLLIFYLITEFSGVPTLHYHRCLGWLTVEEILTRRHEFMQKVPDMLAALPELLTQHEANT